MKTLVLGASDKPDRYSYKAILALRKHNIEVVAIGNKEASVGDVTIVNQDWSVAKDIDTVTLYLNPLRQKEWQDRIVELKPRRVIFNPGTENPNFAAELEAHQIIAQEACTLVLLSIDRY